LGFDVCAIAFTSCDKELLMHTNFHPYWFRSCCVLLLIGIWAQGSALNAQLTFTRSAAGPVVTAANSNSTWHSQHAANPSVVYLNGTYYMYFRGISDGNPSTVGVWTASSSGFNGTNWNQTPTNNPILTPSSGTFDSTGIYDPAAVVFNSKVYLYYMGTGTGTSQVGLAISTDGLTFEKQGVVWSNGGTPAPVVTSSGIALLYTQENSNGGWGYWTTTSTDGIHFGAGQQSLQPSGVSGTFDQMSTITARVFYQSPYYYMLYGGSPSCPDYPEGIGLARSTDLTTWAKYPGNPVLLRGPSGGWDEAAVWSATYMNVNGSNYLWYEGAGSNSGAGSNDSNTARDTCYGGYSSFSWSQIGLATAPSATFQLSDWVPSNDIPTQFNYVLRAAHDGQCLETENSSTGNGGNVQQNSCSGDSNQSWQLQSVNGGYYQVSNVHSGAPGNEVLDVSGQSVLNDANVDQWQWLGDQNQQWWLSPVSSGTYQVVNRNSDQILDVSGASTTPGANVDQWPWLDVSNQEWSLVRNWIQNPGFESGTEANWGVWTGDNNASASYVESGSYSGSYRLTHYSSNPFQVYTSQTITNIPNGRYTLTARVVGGGGQNAAYLSAKGFNSSGNELTTSVTAIESGWPNWAIAQIQDIQVENNQIIVGAYTYDSNGGTWISFDDFTLLQQ